MPHGVDQFSCRLRTSFHCRLTDAGLPPEAPAQGSEQKATFGGHRNAAWDLDRLQTFLRDAMTGIGQKGREIQAPGVAPGWEAN